jgi:uncharacterized membrane protein YjjP (DUF1212 family)
MRGSIFKILFYLLPFVLLLTSESLLMDFISDVTKVRHDVKYYSHGLIQALSLISCIIFFHKLTPFLRMWFIAITGIFVFLFFESLVGYRAYAVYPHVFTKITILYTIPGLYLYYL